MLSAEYDSEARYCSPVTMVEPGWAPPTPVQAWWARSVYPGPLGTRFVAIQGMIVSLNSFAKTAEGICEGVDPVYPEEGKGLVQRLKTLRSSLPHEPRMHAWFLNHISRIHNQCEIINPETLLAHRTSRIRPIARNSPVIHISSQIPKSSM